MTDLAVLTGDIVRSTAVDAAALDTAMTGAGARRRASRRACRAPPPASPARAATAGNWC